MISFRDGTDQQSADHASRNHRFDASPNEVADMYQDH